MPIILSCKPFVYQFSILDIYHKKGAGYTGPFLDLSPKLIYPPLRLLRRHPCRLVRGSGLGRGVRARLGAGLRTRLGLLFGLSVFIHRFAQFLASLQGGFRSGFDAGHVFAFQGVAQVAQRAVDGQAVVLGHFVAIIFQRFFRLVEHAVALVFGLNDFFVLFVFFREFFRVFYEFFHFRIAQFQSAVRRAELAEYRPGRIYPAARCLWPSDVHPARR